MAGTEKIQSYDPASIVNSPQVQESGCAGGVQSAGSSSDDVQQQIIYEQQQQEILDKEAERRRLEQQQVNESLNQDKAGNVSRHRVSNLAGGGKV